LTVKEAFPVDDVTKPVEVSIELSLFNAAIVPANDITIADTKNNANVLFVISIVSPAVH